MTKPWQYKNTQDKLSVFVSSRLKECSDERAVVKKAIISLNHTPVLFEHLGAKSYSARDLYLSRLKDSQVMVAIYRLGYGYIDKKNDMTISGLEDEYQFAKKENIDILAYVSKEKNGREEKLQTLLSDISSELAISNYDVPENLHNRVRDDVTALVTEKFITASVNYSGAMLETPEEILNKTAKASGVIVLRRKIITDITNKLVNTPILCVHGEAGIGKTTISAQIAKEIKTVFLRATDLSPKELFSACSDLLNGKSLIEKTPYVTLEGARLALASAWAESSYKTLVIDECDYIQELIDALSLGETITSSKNLLYTSRTPSNIYENIEMPKLNSKEATELFENSPWRSEIDKRDVVESSPLSIQSQLMRRNGDSYSVAKNIKGTSGEILKYLALSPIPLSAEHLLTLRSDENYTIDNLESDIKELGAIVDDSPRGYRLMHTETASSIVIKIKESHQLYRFFLNRLVLLMEELKNYRHAYELAFELDERKSEKYIDRAIRDAMQLGDWHFVSPLIERLISKSDTTDSKSEVFYLMISLLYPLELMGKLEKANEILTRAKLLVVELGEKEALSLEEVELGSRIRRAMLTSDIDALLKIYQHYAENKMFWNQARVGTELSAIYIASKNYHEAEKILRPTLVTFKELGDEYGIDIAEKNLASALLEIPEKKHEAESLIASINKNINENIDNRRQRAWLCNVNTRLLRAEKKYDEAKQMALEAFDIAKELGDVSLQALNQLNLGNIYRDSNDPFKAIDIYNNSASLAKVCVRNDIEADAYRLIAGIYNDLYDDEEPKYEYAENAKDYSQHAVDLVRNTISYESFIGASLELSDALKKLKQTEIAIKILFEAASAARLHQDEEQFSRLINHAVDTSLPDYVDFYLYGIALSLDEEYTDPEQSYSDRFLKLFIPIMEKAPKASLIHLLGHHLGVVWGKLPPLIRKGFLNVILDDFDDFAGRMNTKEGSWRILYSAIVIASMLKDTTLPYAHHKLARSISSNVDDVFLREEGDGSIVWTIVLELDQRVTVSIFSLDTTPASNLAAFSLSMFMKAFENDLLSLIGGEVSINELTINIALFSEMPKDLRESTIAIDLRNSIENQHCVVTRPVTFKENMPTMVILGSSFTDDIFSSNNFSNSLAQLFGFTLVEITHQLLHGEVEMDTIASKVISLVRKAQP